MSGEKSGKDMLLKVAENLTAAVAGTANFTAAGHGLTNGDLVMFLETEGTSFNTSRFYFVTDGSADGTNSAIDGTIFKLALVPDGAAIVCDVTDATVNMVAYKTVGGLRTSSFSYSAENVDVSNHGSNQWKTLKSGAGMRSAKIAGKGVYSNATNYRAMEASAFANSLVSLAFLDVDAGRIYSGSFKISSLDNSGDYSGEAAFSIAAESSGTVSIAQLGT